MAKTISKDIDKLLALHAQATKVLSQTPKFTSEETYKRSKKRDHEGTIIGNNDKKQLKKTKVTLPKNSGNIIKNGTPVAAKTPKSKDPEENWILATVVGYRADIKQYEVEDADKDEASNRPGERFTVLAKNVIEIPNPGEMQLPEFPTSHLVFALFPSTTCFYRAFVVTPPSKLTPKSKSPRYKLTFEDDGNAERLVDSQYVLDVPKENP
ncbi:7417_t:CDS:2 [Diversispora eburnea]|uniref:7417_t:CDS:1 n=1 Tax=Diversispora eburnea TaxID=1213867 RepID=A0A9N9C9P6_9GLOM|nr:7417_t:CDS:2 [Diversispora eburnea]